MSNPVSVTSSATSRAWTPNHALTTRRGHRHGDSDSVQNNAPAIASPMTRIWAGLSSAVSTLRNQLGSLTTSSSPSDSGSVGFGAQLISKQRGELQIQTQEGDVVTLKFSNKLGVSIDAAQTSDGTNTTTAVSAEVHSRSRIAVAVQGDLNDEELAAINNLVDQVGSLTSDFFNGNLDSVLSKVAGLNFDSSQLANYSLDLSLKQSLSAYAYQTLPPAAVSTPTVLPSPTIDSTAIDTPVGTSTTAAPTVDEIVADPVPTSTTDAAASTDNTSTPVAAKPAVSGSQALSLTDFIAKARATFTMQQGDSHMGFSYEFKAKLLVASIEASSPPDATPSEPALTTLADQLTTATA